MVEYTYEDALRLLDRYSIEELLELQDVEPADFLKECLNSGLIDYPDLDYEEDTDRDLIGCDDLFPEQSD